MYVTFLVVFLMIVTMIHWLINELIKGILQMLLLLIVAADTIAPLTGVSLNSNPSKKGTPAHIKRMFNRRKNLLRIERCKRDGHHLTEIRTLNKSIHRFFVEKRKLKVRSVANGPAGNLWRAVGVARDVNPDAIPTNLTVGGENIDPKGIAGAFGNYFFNKIKSNVSKSSINVNGVYNGKCKIIVQNRNFMTENDVKLCLSELKNKKCEGFDRIPVCVLLDARSILLHPMAMLFNEIYKCEDLNKPLNH